MLIIIEIFIKPAISDSKREDDRLIGIFNSKTQGPGGYIDIMITTLDKSRLIPQTRTAIEAAQMSCFRIGSTSTINRASS